MYKVLLDAQKKVSYTALYMLFTMRLRKFSNPFPLKPNLCECFAQGVKSPSDLRLELVVLNWLLEFRMTTWSDSTATSHANTCTPTHDFFHFEACIQLRSFQKLWDDSQRAFQYQFRSWLLFFNIILKI